MEKYPTPILERKPRRKRIIGSLPLFKTESLESESETDALPLHSYYIQYVSRRKVCHDPKFGVHQEDTDRSFKIGRSSFKYKGFSVLVTTDIHGTTQIKALAVVI